jgi:hypothetical protein
MKFFRLRSRKRPTPVPKSVYDESEHTLEHVPISASADWRRDLLAQAALKHGKPFKCAAETMPREVVICRKEVAPAAPEPETGDTENVTHLEDRRRTRRA